MLKRHEVEVLLKAGHPKTEVDRLAGVCLCSVKRIAEENPVVHVDDARERAERKVGRPSMVANFQNQADRHPAESTFLPSKLLYRSRRSARFFLESGCSEPAVSTGLGVAGLRNRSFDADLPQRDSDRRAKNKSPDVRPVSDSAACVGQRSPENLNEQP